MKEKQTMNNFVEKFQTLITEYNTELEKVQKGNKSACGRLRKVLLEFRKEATEYRKAVQEYKDGLPVKSKN